MKLILESTSKIVELNGGIQARVWEGHTVSGIEVHCFITRVAVSKDADATQFEHELREQRAPSAEIEAYPLRMIL